MKKIPKDIQQLVNKGNFVIAIKELSKRDNISLDEAKNRIDAYEETQNNNTKPPQSDGLKKSSNNAEFDSLLSSVESNIDLQKKYPVPFAWMRLGVILIIAVILGVIAYRFI